MPPTIRPIHYRPDRAPPPFSILGLFFPFSSLSKSTRTAAKSSKVKPGLRSLPRRGVPHLSRPGNLGCEDILFPFSYCSLSSRSVADYQFGPSNTASSPLPTRSVSLPTTLPHGDPHPPGTWFASNRPLPLLSPFPTTSPRIFTTIHSHDGPTNICEEIAEGLKCFLIIHWLRSNLAGGFLFHRNTLQQQLRWGRNQRQDRCSSRPRTP